MPALLSLPLLLLTAPEAAALKTCSHSRCEPAAEVSVSAARLARAPQSKKSKKGAKVKKPDRMTYWVGELEAARVSAKERGVGLLILAMLSDEEDNDAFADNLADNRNLGIATQNVIVVLVNNGTHDQRDKTFIENGEKVTRKVCSVFHTRNCTEHQRNWDVVYRDYVLIFDPEADWSLPEAIILDPEGEIHERLGEGVQPDESDIESSIKEVQRKFGLGLTVEQVRAVKAAGDIAKKRARREEWAGAYTEYQKVLALATRGRFADEADLAAKVALEKMGDALREASSKLTPESIRVGFSALMKMKVEYAGTPLEKEVATTIKKAEKDKSLKDLIEVIKSEFKAAELWEEAQALIKQGERKKALRIAKKLLGRKYASTPAAEAARKEFAELKGDG